MSAATAASRLVSLRPLTSSAVLSPNVTTTSLTVFSSSCSFSRYWVNLSSMKARHWSSRASEDVGDLADEGHQRAGLGTGSSTWAIRTWVNRSRSGAQSRVVPSSRSR